MILNRYTMKIYFYKFGIIDISIFYSFLVKSKIIWLLKMRYSLHSILFGAT